MARLAAPEGEPMQGQEFKGRMDGAAKEETVRGVFAKTRPIQLAVVATKPPKKEAAPFAGSRLSTGGL